MTKKVEKVEVTQENKQLVYLKVEDLYPHPDNPRKDLGELTELSDSIKAKDANLVGKMASEGTTPRQLTDLIGSLCDLTSGSGDKGTPVVLVQGYFDNYTN